ncbi:MAG: hypothetical protein HYX65_04490 [Gemmatimonadetes bacterium]|nr:hypothetical protein [Gemmatimonadota bacterium]
MTDAHLTPADLELLVDDDTVPAAVALLSHVAACEPCRTALEEARFVAEMLSTAPHLKPPREFTDKVMTQVQVTEPWYMAAAGVLRAMWPDRGAGRTIMAAAGVLAGLVTTVGVLALAMRSDEAAMLGSMVGDRWRETLAEQASGVVGTAFGSAALDMLRERGWMAVAVALPAFLAMSGVALAGLRAVGARARERRP